MNSFEVGRGRKLGKSTIPIWQSLLLGSPFFQSTETLENTSFVLILVPFVAKAVGEEPVKLSDKKQPTAAIPASPLVASEQSEEVALEPPIEPPAVVVKFGSYPKMSSNLPRRSSLLAAKKLLPASKHTGVAQTSSASVDLSLLRSCTWKYGC